MKVARVFIMICVVCTTTTFSQSIYTVHHVSRLEGEQLQLNTTILKKKYCSSTSMRLTLRLNFTNLTDETLILYRYSSIISRYMISGNLRSALAMKYKTDVSPMVNFGVPDAFDSILPDDSLFVVLEPSESYDLERSMYVGVYDGAKYSDDFLHPGNYVLQVQVGTWYSSPALALKLRDQWRKVGYLWTDTVTSYPMPFAVEKERQVSNCSSQITADTN